jgi:hypothetical protein
LDLYNNIPLLANQPTNPLLSNPITLELLTPCNAQLGTTSSSDIQHQYHYYFCLAAAVTQPEFSKGNGIFYIIRPMILKKATSLGVVSLAIK